MAAAIIPLVATIAPSIIDLITGLVHKSAPAQEANLGVKTGPVKFANVFGDVITALQNAAGAGQIDKVLPSDEAIKIVIQAVVSSMKIAGMLGVAPAPPAPKPASQSFALASGQTLTLSVA